MPNRFFYTGILLLTGLFLTACSMKHPSALKIEDLQEGNGAIAENGDLVQVHYTGTLENGKKFDSSKDRNRPFEFNLGEGEVIAGWYQGVLGMKVGGVRKLTIPANLGYGSRGIPGVIPRGASLIFEVELLAIDGKE